MRAGTGYLPRPTILGTPELVFRINNGLRDHIATGKVAHRAPHVLAVPDIGRLREACLWPGELA
jgi:hypothetical protein